MTDVIIRDYGLSEVALDLVILFGFAVGALLLSATTLRRQFIAVLWIRKKRPPNA